MRIGSAKTAAMRNFVLPILLLLLTIGSFSGEAHRPILNMRIPARIEMRPVILKHDEPSLRRVGELTFLGGWQLDSSDPAFGSYSALVFDGGRFTAISDAGGVLSFAMDARDRIIEPRFGDLAQGPGRGLEKIDRDAESLAVDPVTGRLWVGYEHWNAIWRYAPGFGRAEASTRPAAMQSWPNNGGAEAMVRLRSGQFLVFSEAGDGPGSSRAALLFPGDPTGPATPVLFGYKPPEGFRITDAAELPDGRLVLLHRRISIGGGIMSKLTVVSRGAIQSGAIVSGREIATLAWPLISDNFEGVAATVESGRRILWLISDDNFSPFQRTLLLKFALDQA